MSKFNVGNWWEISEFDGAQEEAIQTAVDYLKADGWELERYLQGNSVDALCDWRYIGLSLYSDKVTVFDSLAGYDFTEGKKLSWAKFKESPSTLVEVEPSLHDIIEEQAAHITNLEEALEMVQKELIELREKVGSEGFKPISEYTMEDWEQAKEEGWVFEMGNDEVYVEGILKEFKDSRHPIEFNLLGSKQHHGTTSVKGYFYSNAPNHSRNIKRRIK